MPTPAPDACQERLFDPPQPIWAGRPHPRSLVDADTEIEGGAFAYGTSPAIFLGRTGWGPLRVAWDTAILIDYGELGADFWETGDLPEDAKTCSHAEELAALVALMDLWMVRDIRIHVLLEQLLDAKRQLSPERWAKREQQLTQIQSALYCLDHQADTSVGNDWELMHDLAKVSGEWDRRLIEGAVNGGCHVFLTRDRGVLRAEDSIARYWLTAMSPTQLLSALVDAGETSLSSLSTPVPDTHKWTHLIAACA